MAHKHSVYDTDAHFKIDGVTRAVKNDSATKTVLVQHDHNSERFTFELPRYVDGHDMSLCNVVQIHYINIESNRARSYSGVYEVDDLQVSPDGDDVVICSWLISRNATQFVGNLSFVIRFACISDENDYVWNTAKHTNIFVTEGIYNGDAVVEEYADILDQWSAKLEEMWSAKLAEIVSCDMFSGYDRFYDSIARMQVNPTEPLNIATYDGSNKPTHPKVLYFKNCWAGHKYWLTYSPFPGNDNARENPCIEYSDDGVNFSSDGITNPIENTPKENGSKVGYNSDPHLVLVNGIMECWWRTHFQSGTNADHEVIFRKTSVDGINWSDKEELFRVADASAGSCLSPAVIFENGIYKIWTVYKQQFLRYYESTTGADWTHIRDINVDNPDYPTYKIWHIDVIHTEKGYEFVGCYHPTSNYDDNRYIYYAISEDNITYSDRVLILTPGKTGNFDATELYRPAILRLENKVRIYYGCRNGFGNWKIGMIEAPNPYLFNAVLNNGLRFADLESRVSALESISIILTGISVTYSGYGEFIGTSVDDIDGIVVTANYSNGSSKTVTEYTLSGTIAEGDNVITVTYEGKNATFTVTGFAKPANIMDNVTWSYGSVLGDTGEPLTGNNDIMTDAFSIKGYAGESVAINSDGNGWRKLAYYDENGAFISCSYSTDATFEAKIPATAVTARAGMGAKGTFFNIATKELLNVKFADLSENVGQYYSPDHGGIVTNANFNSRMVPLDAELGIYTNNIVSGAFFNSKDEMVGNFNVYNGAVFTVTPSGAVRVGLNYRVEQASNAVAGAIVGRSEVTEILT